MTSPTARHPVIVATLWMSGALLSFMLMALAGRELSSELSTFQILFFRSSIGLPILVALIWRTGWAQLSLRHLKLHFARNTVHIAGQYGWFYAVGVLPLAEVFAIEFTTPIWTALFAALLLGERLTASRVAAIVIGIAGVLVILRPGFAAIGAGTFAVLAAAVFFALSIVAARSLVQRETPLAILFWMAVMQLPPVVWPALADWVTPSPRLWPWLLVVGLAGFGAHYFLARAVRLVDATVIGPMDFLRLPLIALIGYLVYGETLDVFVIAGAAIMLSGNFMHIRAERSVARAPAGGAARGS